MNSSMVINYYFKEEIIMMWYEEKDMDSEVVKDYMFMSGNENSRPDTVNIVSEKYDIRLRICSSGLRTWEGKYAEAFENCYSKVVKIGYNKFFELSLEDREMYTELIIKEWSSMLELMKRLKGDLDQLKTALQKEAGNRKLVKIGVGINNKTGRPNFQIWLKIESLSVKLTTSKYDGPDVELKGTLYCAKNWSEVQKGNYDEIVKSLVEPYGVGTSRHQFQLSGLLSPDATRELQEMTLALSKFRVL